MLQTVAVVLLILWLLGFSFSIAAGTIHVLLVIAIILLLVKLIGS